MSRCFVGLRAMACKFNDFPILFTRYYSHEDTMNENRRPLFPLGWSPVNVASFLTMMSYALPLNKAVLVFFPPQNEKILRQAAILEPYVVQVMVKGLNRYIITSVAMSVLVSVPHNCFSDRATLLRISVPNRI